MEKITILIADDHTLVRETWSFILNTDPRFQVIAECSSGEEAVELVLQLQPQVVIMDINLPGINGIEATRQIHTRLPGTRILGVSMHTQPNYARKMLQNGARGYVTKSSSREEMVSAILQVQDGKKYICEEIKDILSRQMINGEELQPGLDALSQREIQVVGLIKKGYSSKQIAESLDISIKTVEAHRYNLLKKLNLRNAASLVNYIHQSEIG
jgi:DNA-binding NarL/FixJ family response regulator